MALPDRDLQAAIAATRFGLGARPGEIDAVRADPQGFLLAQTTSRPVPDPIRALPVARAEALQAFRQAQAAFLKANRQQDRKAVDLRPELSAARTVLRDQIAADVLERAARGATTEAGFAERWALFWANHFSVGAGNFVRTATIGPYEAAAIRPHVFGRFADLLVAAETHPAMLLYLDQNGSVGPDSPLAQRMARGKAAQRQVGLN
ncbi:MAG: DUF1800 family protein, partial [Phenylobacterium sp.]|nr:DUF1800 family protein [Phenylobacterium sp.]